MSTKRSERKVGVNVSRSNDLQYVSRNCIVNQYIQKKIAENGTYDSETTRYSYAKDGEIEHKGRSTKQLEKVFKRTSWFLYNTKHSNESGTTSNKDGS